MLQLVAPAPPIGLGPGAWNTSPCSLRLKNLSPCHLLPQIQKSGPRFPSGGPDAGAEPYLHACVVEGDVVGEKVQVAGSEDHRKQDLALP